MATACSTPQLAVTGRCWASHKASVKASFSVLMASWAKPEEVPNCELSVVEHEAWEVEAGVNLEWEGSVFWLIWFPIPCMWPWPQGVTPCKEVRVA